MDTKTLTSLNHNSWNTICTDSIYLQSLQYIYNHVIEFVLLQI